MPPENRQNQPGDDPAAALLAQVWRLAPVGLALVTDGTVIAWNPQAERLLATSVGGAPGAWQRWLEAAAARLLARPDAPSVLDARQPRAPQLELQVAGDGRRDGLAVVVLRSVPAESEHAAVGGLVETVSTLSHELRTPLAAIKSSLALVLGGDAGALTVDQSRFVGVALRNVTRLDRLVGDLLDIARDDAGRLQLDCRPCDLGPVLREALTLCASGDGQSGPRLDTRGLPVQFRACVDPDKITQIVTNLVGNARKYVPAEGRVRVWLDPHPGPVEPFAANLARTCGLQVRTFALVVEDNGPGIDPAIIDRVFEPFERGRAEVIGRIGGAGLGLHIVRRLAEAHGGRVSLASAPEAGTTVWVRLPVDAASAQLLQAAVQLRGPARSDREMAPGVGLALLDVRENAEPAVAADTAARLQAGRAALAALPPGAVGRPCEPAPGVLAVAVLDPDLWHRQTALAAAGWRPLAMTEGPEGPADGVIDGKPLAAEADNHACLR